MVEITPQSGGLIFASASCVAIVFFVMALLDGLASTIIDQFSTSRSRTRREN